MKSGIVAVMVVLGVALTGNAQMTTSVKVVVPASDVEAITRLLDGMAPLYENQLIMVTNVIDGNVVVTPTTITVEVRENKKKKLRRISADVLSEYWGRQVQLFEREAIKQRKVVDTAE